jgi:hypothetical protein
MDAQTRISGEIPAGVDQNFPYMRLKRRVRPDVLLQKATKARPDVGCKISDARVRKQLAF